MAKRVWQEIKVQNCKHAGGNVALEAEVLYPDDFMPDTPPAGGGAPLLARSGMRLAERGLLRVGRDQPDLRPLC